MAVAVVVLGMAQTLQVSCGSTISFLLGGSPFHRYSIVGFRSRHRRVFCFPTFSPPALGVARGSLERLVVSVGTHRHPFGCSCTAEVSSDLALSDGGDSVDLLVLVWTSCGEYGMNPRQRSLKTRTWLRSKEPSRLCRIGIRHYSIEH